MKSLRIIIVMLEPPLPFGNAAARWFYVLLKGLVDRGHQVTAFASCSNSLDIDKAKQIFPDYDLRCFPHPTRSGFLSKLETFREPYSYSFSSELKKQLNQELTKPFDILHLEQLWTGWLGLEHKHKALLNIHHLIWIDQQFIKPTNIEQFINRYLTFSTERKLINSFKYIRSCSPRLELEIKNANPDAKITNIPVGIDLSQYIFISDHHRSEQLILSLIGNMNWYPGYSAAIRLLTRLWAKIKGEVKDVKLQIVGWSARSALHDYLDLPDVIITENVPDIRPYFESTSVFLYAPARGSGMKIKILEALAWGIPIVTTSEGVEGLPALDGMNVGICDHDEGLIERTIKLLQNPSLQNKQRLAGRSLIEEVCSPQITLDALESLYGKMISAR